MLFFSANRKASWNKRELATNDFLDIGLSGLTHIDQMGK